MSKVYYICKYTPIEIIRAFGDEPCELDYSPEGFELAENHVHPNVCGFGKSIIEAVLSQGITRLVLVNCCDTIKAVYDVLVDMGCMEFIYMFDMMRGDGECTCALMEKSIRDFRKAYEAYKDSEFNTDRFLESFDSPKKLPAGPYICVLGARMGEELYNMTLGKMPLPVVNRTCLNNRNLAMPESDYGDDAALVKDYALALMGQMPCMRMHNPAARRSITEDGNIAGIIYHTIKFCDFYGFEYADIKNRVKVPFLKIESDYTVSAYGQLSTRLSAFAEGLSAVTGTIESSKRKTMNKGYFVGVDSGSTSTDIVIIDKDANIISRTIIPTGAGASQSAQKALQTALEAAKLTPEDIDFVITTGYGRDAVTMGDKSITEISCHAKGAKFLDSSVRTVIDIGGQDSKVIILSEDGSVENFVMNDKCAAGTGRFLEMMASTMQMQLDEMSGRGIRYKEDITISSMCTVFAESEVVSLIASNKETDDIVHGLNKAVATKTVSLVKRAGGSGPFMMTGGVAKNKGLLSALKEKLGEDIIVSPSAQLCGAIGAALFAREAGLPDSN